MHDPLVVAFEIKVPIPRRSRWRERAAQPRWMLRRTRFTNDASRFVYPWWRPKGYDVRIAGRAYAWREIITIWHVEPGGRDAFEVCKHRRQKRNGEWVYTKRWAWHVHHWHLQIHLLGKLKRWLLERCERCGRRYPWGYAPVSHQWDSPRTRWRNGIQRRAFHHECSALGSRERQVAQDAEIIRGLVSYLRTLTDRSEEEIVNELCGFRATWADFPVRYQLEKMLGYKHADDDSGRLVKVDPTPEKERA